MPKTRLSQGKITSEPIIQGHKKLIFSGVEDY